MARAFSAPGKALLVGGYLVLDPQYKSYVVALSSRMHAVVEHSASEDFKVRVKSSQFNNDQWSYTIEKNEVGNYSPKEVRGLNNPFVEKTVMNVFNYFKPEHAGLDIKIAIFSDSGYHSQEKSTVKSNEHKAFNFHSNTITKVPKTGLGSSAGLVTVLTTALTSCFVESCDVADPAILNIIHNLAQTAHCQAQGKVGSGFDVAAATFGSILYRRFMPELINDLPDYNKDPAYSVQLKKLISDTPWEITNDRISLPKGLRLIMGDVNNGSETTKLVAKVKEWYQKDTVKSLELYTQIDKGNMDFIEGLENLNKLSESDSELYQSVIDSIDTNTATHPLLCGIQNSIERVRASFRAITKESGAEIEPEVQTQLLDGAICLPGVLTGMVPGAGGYDAISLITTLNCDIVSLTAGDKKFKSVTYLDLNQEDVGIKEEVPAQYENLE